MPSVDRGITVNYLSKCHTFPVRFVISFCIGLPFKMATYSKSSNVRCIDLSVEVRL